MCSFLFKRLTAFNVPYKHRIFKSSYLGATGRAKNKKQIKKTIELLAFLSRKLWVEIHEIIRAHFQGVFEPGSRDSTQVETSEMLG